MVRQMTITPVNQMTTSRHSNLLKGKTLILALTTTEKVKLYNKLDVYRRELVDRIEHYCYGG